MHLIKDDDGREYYWIPIQRKVYPESFLLYAWGFLTARAGSIFGAGAVLLSFFAAVALFLLLSPLYLYVLHFVRADSEDDVFLPDDGYYSASYRLACGLFIAGGLALLALTFILLFAGDSSNTEKANLAGYSSIRQAYEDTREYASQRMGKADIIDFYIRYEGIEAMRSGEASSWHITFQDTPGLMPCPNKTMLFLNLKNEDMELCHDTYVRIKPTYDAGLVTNPSEILDILISNTKISIDSGISALRIRPARRLPLEAHNPFECVVMITWGEPQTDENIAEEYIVNIRDKTVRPG